MLRTLLVLALLGFIISVNAVTDDDPQTVLLAKLNEQIMYEMKASYFYQAYGHFFDRSDVALPGMAKWFEAASKEERGHATGLMEYMNKRDFKISLKNIEYSGLCGELQNKGGNACICKFMSQTSDPCNDRDSWGNALTAMEDTLELEKYVNDKLIELHGAADDAKDPHLQHILEHDYLDEQVEAIKKIKDYITQLKRVETGLGEYLFDKEL